MANFIELNNDEIRTTFDNHEELLRSFSNSLLDIKPDIGFYHTEFGLIKSVTESFYTNNIFSLVSRRFIDFVNPEFEMVRETL